jgi:hypothetical protein
MTMHKRGLAVAEWLALLLLAALMAGCKQPGASPATATAPPTEVVLAATTTSTASQAPAPSTPTASARDDPLAGAREALAAYQPVADARPVVDALLEGVAAWLEAGGDAGDLADALGPVPGGAEPAAAQVWEVDLTGDDRPDTALYIPVMGLPLFVFTTGADASQVSGHILPEDLGSIQTDFPLEQTEWAAGRPAVEILDLTGDGPPEVLFTTLGAGASSVHLFPRFYQWHAGGFRLIFAATLVDWAGRSQLDLEPDSLAEGAVQIVLTYPRLYRQGFDHKMANHPMGRQVWRWSPGTGRYVAAEESVDLQTGAWGPEMPPTVEDLLRWLTNEAEIPFRGGEYEQAITGYDAVLRLAKEDGWQPGEGEGNWPALAAFRRAEAMLLAGEVEGGREAMAAVAEVYADDRLGELARSFLDGYGQASGPEAAAWGVAAMQEVPLYDHFYYEEPGALRFPMDAAGVLYAGAGLAAYLQAHPELAGDPKALQAGFAEAGYDVVEVTLAEGGGVQIALAPPEVAHEGGPPPSSWLLAPGGEGWHIVLPAAANGNGWPMVGTF